MRRAWLALILLPVLALAACTGGVKSSHDVAGDLAEVYPLTEGHYRLPDVGNDEGLLLVRDAEEGYRFDDPKNTGPTDQSIRFRILAMPELPPTNFLAQVIDAKRDRPEYTYYFVIVSAGQIAVLSPSRYDLAALPETLKDRVSVESTDEVVVTDPSDTLAVLRTLASGRLELMAQFIREE